MDPITFGNPPGDEPNAPPPFVTEAIPDWDACGEESCGYHSHPEDDAVSATHAPTHWTCHSCEDSLSASHMHSLRCGHKLCGPCLKEAAEDSHWNIIANAQDIESRLRRHDALVRLAARANSAEVAAVLQEAAISQRLKAFDMAGFMCCDRLSGLWEYVCCMDPVTAKTTWKDLYYLLTPIHRRLWCGWPDCGEFVPLVCLYEDKHDESPRWYCVWCEGNSQYSGSSGVLRSCPAR